MGERIDIRTKLGSLFLIGIPGPVLDDETRHLLDTIRPGFLILFDRNIQSAAQVKRLLGDINEYLNYAPVVSIDQEGGVVTRLREGFSVSPGARALAAGSTPEQSFLTGRIMGTEMADLGIRWDLAPVVDVNNNPQNPGIGIRSFGEDIDTVIVYAGEFLKGLNASGVEGCLKHFPGKGRVGVDAHIDLSILDVSLDELKRVELRPFLDVDAAAWMPSHIYIPELQEKREPLTVSREILTGMVRDELKFDGVLVADDLTMGGISLYYEPEEAIERCFDAGMDILTVCHDSKVQIRRFEHLVTHIGEDEHLARRLEESSHRVERFVARIDELAKKAVAGGTGKLPADRNAFFLERSTAALEMAKGEILRARDAELVVAPRLSRQAMVEDPQEGIPWVAEQLKLREGLPIRAYGRDDDKASRAELAAEAAGKKVIVFTENAHLDPDVAEFIGGLCAGAFRALLVALRNPYDRDIPGADHVLLSYGYARPQQQALLAYLTGEIIRT